MSQTMIKKALFTTPSSSGKTEDELMTEIGQSLATILGCNYDTTKRILYMGEDNSIGIYLRWTSSYVDFRLFRNGSTDSNGLTIYPGYSQQQLQYNSQYTLRYIKTDNTLLFAFDSTDERQSGYKRIKCGMVKGKVITDNDAETWIYFGLYGYEFYEVHKNSLITNRTYAKTAFSSSEAISLAPFIISEGDVVITSDYLFNVNTCAVTQYNTAFMFNDSEYLIITNESTDIAASKIIRLAVKLT